MVGHQQLTISCHISCLSKQPDGSINTPNNEFFETVTMSGLRDRVIEATAIALEAFGRDTTKYASNITLAKRFLLSQRRLDRNWGGYYANFMAVSALTPYILQPI